MGKELLEKVLYDGVENNLNSFFCDVSNNYVELGDNLPAYDDDRFADFRTIGEIVFNPNEKLVVVTAKVLSDLTERSGKKAQYEKAKKILKDFMKYDAGIFVFSDSAGSFRFSLVYGQAQGTRRVFSNFRRFTYFVSKDQTNKTFYDRIGKCDFSSLDIIKDTFSVEKVNKEFYAEIAKYYYRLTGKSGYKRGLALPSVGEGDDRKYEEFAVRLIGRVIFCWFLRHKKSSAGIPLAPKEVLSLGAAENHADYYHSILEPLFFEAMNRPAKERKPVTIPQSDMIPFLNGGLFEPHVSDYYKDIPNYALKIPDKWFVDFFSVLEQYNFTIDENSTVDADVSVDPEMLGRIFENLLAEVVPETEETARKATGSYYTPRAIVDYMVEQSLKQYLLTRTNLPEDKLDSLLSYEDNEADLSDADRNAIVTALKEIKVIDPACGSGAFPMGVLHRMLLVLEKADPKLEIWRRQYLDALDPIVRQVVMKNIRRENWAYIRKLMIIRDCIYGVDIQPIAVEIAKLRCFLSLIVDEIVLDNEENRGVEPLPNLEFKFVAANTLISLPKLASQSAFGVTETINKLKELRERYLRSFGVEKEQIEKEFRTTQQKLFKENVQWAVADTLVKQLTEWDPFSYESCGWFDPGWMFGIEDGFDIIIANPPYLGEKGHKEIFRQIKQGTLKEYYQGKMDIFYFFFHLAIDLGRDGAQTAFITTSYYPTATSASKLRRDFKKRTIIRRLVNFNELRIFESAQGQHNMLTILSKGHDMTAIAKTCITKHQGDATSQVLQSILSWQDEQTDYYQVLQKDLYDGDECYIRLTGNAENSNDLLQGILYKVKHQGQELWKFCNINQGIISGADKVTQKHLRNFKIKANVGDGIFILENSEVDYLGLSNSEKKILKPWFKNSDIGRWWTNNTHNEYLIYADKRLQNLEGNRLKRHLLKFKDILDHSTDNSPYLHRPRDIDFCGPKIVAPQRSPRNTFGYNEIPWYASADVYFITKKDEGVDLKYCLALLNSKLYYLWLYFRGKRKGESLELYQVPLSEIPIKKVSKTNQRPFISVVDKILAITKDQDYLSNPAKQARVKELQSQIDRMVYELYGLTEEEIAIVEGTFKK